ncbi:MAG: lipid-A-disaccharide synthase [Dysgonamonadaceae bacterium]|jgi:lipid-A-disaccharide synthase|nr:lipid-A-disaccharide synthase [Dysgonamonadaceae bacterium]
MKYYLIAGEASGDLHGSNLMKSLKKIDRNAEFRYFGGDLMQSEGGTLVKHYRDLAFMGFIPVLMNLKTILKNMKICRTDIKSYQPDGVILIDYPGFNLKMARFVKEELHIPVYYYISPKIWAWKEYRIKNIKRDVDKMLCILPFEVDFYKKHRFPVDYVGNPSVDAFENREYKSETFDEFTANNQLSNKPIIALLAGSRKQEIKDNLPMMLRVVHSYPDYQAVIAGSPGMNSSFYNQFIENQSVSIVFDQTYRLLQQAEAALVTSGTATLETSLFRVPQVVCYKTPVKHLVSFVWDRFFKVKYISLVNLIAEKEVVKELFGKYFSFEQIKNELDAILFDDEYKKQMDEGYREVLERLGQSGASDNTAKLIFQSLSGE